MRFQHRGDRSPFTSPPTPTSRSGSSERGIGCASWTWILTRRLRPSFGARLDAVLTVVYLLFSQGCHVTHGDIPIRRDLCDEARRLARMLAAHPVGDVPGVHALLALMCFHGARFEARVAGDGAIVLLEEQDRSAWNWSDVREGMAWLARSAAGDELTRYHVEAGIAWEHCPRGPSPTPIGAGSPNCTTRSIASRRRHCTP